MDTVPTPPQPFVDFGREISGDLATAEQREWLVTNGIGGFASGTVAGLLTRRYHGLLIAALTPPLDRKFLVAKLDETLECYGQTYPLFTNRWADGAVDPSGYRQIERFRLEGTIPVWTFSCADVRLEKRIWMQQGSNTTYVRYDLVRGVGPFELSLKALVNYRDFHQTTHAGDWRMAVERIEHGLRVRAFDGATPFYLLSSSAAAEPAHNWHRDFDLAAERARGLEDREDHLLAGTFGARLRAGDSVTVVATTEPASNLDGRSAYKLPLSYAGVLLNRWSEAHPKASRKAPGWVRQLVLAAGQFIVDRVLPGLSEGHSVIAGYPWFGVWGRDTMIALAGLTLATGRPEVARSILRTCSKLVDSGTLLNSLPAAGGPPDYTSVDASLWYFEALRNYEVAEKDMQLLGELFPVLSEIIDCYARGTRNNIHVDPMDGLLYAGGPGVQLTWMDAKVGDRVVTPRVGKPVEVNSLWLNALATMGSIARKLRKPAGEYEAMAKRARSSFQRFWSQSAGWCYDVIDGPEGDDLTLRPNQIFAVSLGESPLRPEQQRAVVDVCARRLLTSYGLRSLAPNDPQYVGHYGGDPGQRDAAYHQGTAWGWLIGPFVLAHLRVYNDPALAASHLEPFAHHLMAHGLGSASEIFNGDSPFTPNGCIAQAWTVAEVLRAWLATVN
jgi:predicted glycogen debranching enzyme